MTYYRTTEMDGLNIFYREAGDRDRAAFRSSSHQNGNDIFASINRQP